MAVVLKTAATIFPSNSKMRRAMKIIVSVLGVMMMVATFAAPQSITDAVSTNLSPAEQSIVGARKAISHKPREYAGDNLLAMALVRRARETVVPRIFPRVQPSRDGAGSSRTGDFRH